MKRGRILVVMCLLMVATLMAAAGTGAIDVFSAKRDVGMSVVSDAAGYVALSTVSPYAKVNANGTLAVDFTCTNTNAVGDGFNAQSFTEVDEVFTVTNQSAEVVYVWFEAEGWSSQHNAGLRYRVGNTNGDVTPVDEWYFKNPDGMNLLSSTGTNYTDGAGKMAYIKLDPGEYFDINMLVNTVNIYGNAGQNWNHKVIIKANNTRPAQTTQYHSYPGFIVY